VLEALPTILRERTQPPPREPVTLVDEEGLPRQSLN
jgi:hypothetical protein